MTNSLTVAVVICTLALEFMSPQRLSKIYKQIVQVAWMENFEAFTTF